MNRGEAYAIDLWTPRGIDVRVAIDAIYDDFESRTCENCKYLELHEDLGCTNIFMSHQVNTTAFGWCYENFITSLDFGCNKFERKLDVNV